MSHLNVICPENFDRILARFVEVQVTTLHELRSIVILILNKALSEPHYCGTYVKLIYYLRDAYPDFLPLPGRTSRRPQSFMTLLIDHIQDEFEKHLLMLQVPGDTDEQLQRKSRLRAMSNMK